MKAERSVAVAGEKNKMATKDLILSCISKSKILRWHVKQGESIKKDNILATYVFTEKMMDLQTL